MKNLFLTIITVLTSLLGKACVITFLYDAAGNRIQRFYDCGGNASNKQNITNWNFASDKLDTNNLYGTNINEKVETIDNICSIYPNPNNGYFRMVLQYPVKDADIYLLDIRGDIIDKRKLTGTETNFNLSQLASGVYTIRLNSNGYEFSAKIVKQ